MVKTMNYSAGMVYRLFVFVETKRTVGMSKEEIREKV